MKVTFELWQLITLAVTLAGAFTGLGKLLLWQFARNVERTLKQMRKDGDTARAQDRDLFTSSLSTIRQNSEKWQNLEREFLRHLAELPVHYVRREDWVRNQTILEGKLDLLSEKIEQIRAQGAKRE